MSFPKHDEETGEAITTLNIETGEEEYITPSTPPREKSKTFKVPSSTYTSARKQRRQAKVKLENSPTVVTAILSLLLTTILFYPILVTIIVIAEVVVHMWAHRKNKCLKEQNLYYQSPLHLISKEFCGKCREEMTTLKITKFQEKRADKFRKYGLEYVRRVVT